MYIINLIQIWFRIILAKSQKNLIRVHYQWIVFIGYNINTIYSRDLQIKKSSRNLLASNCSYDSSVYINLYTDDQRHMIRPSARVKYTSGRSPFVRQTYQRESAKDREGESERVIRNAPKLK